ncbi:hypothetical protein [Tianweitania sp.]|uniref:hypothetical protein n=1 Tax=Tianweitania sp. TaxID=2021634 RepID=UPI0028A1E420|nr:hypothetical protein [Tianweitania sp.]
MSDHFQPNSQKKEQNPASHRSNAIGIAITLLAAVLGLAWLWSVYWIFTLQDSANDISVRERIDMARNVGLLLLGLVGLPLAIWRSWTASLQTREAIAQGKRVERQLIYTARQIAVTEESNLAKLFQDGVAALVDSDPVKVSAGIATLSIVARTAAEPFGNEARVLLLQYVRKFGEQGHGGQNVQRAITALNSAYTVRSDNVMDQLNFEEDADEGARYDDYEAPWELVFGAEHCSYSGGVFYGRSFEGELHGFIFRGTTFMQCAIDNLDHLDVHNCFFNQCRIKAGTLKEADRSSFYRCDFSAAVLQLGDEITDLGEKGNYYRPGKTPKLMKGGMPVELSDFLVERSPGTPLLP